MNKATVDTQVSGGVNYSSLILLSLFVFIFSISQVYSLPTPTTIETSHWQLTTNQSQTDVAIASDLSSQETTLCAVPSDKVETFDITQATTDLMSKQTQLSGGLKGGQIIEPLPVKEQNCVLTTKDDTQVDLTGDGSLVYDWVESPPIYSYNTDVFDPNPYSVTIIDGNGTQYTNIDWITNATEGQAIKFYPNITKLTYPLTRVTFHTNKLEDIKTKTDGLWNYQSGTKLDFTDFESKNIITNKTITPNQKGVTACLLDVTDDWTIFQFAKCALSINSYDVTYTGTIIDLDPTLIVVNTSSANVWNNQTQTEPNNITHLAIQNYFERYSVYDAVDDYVNVSDSPSMSGLNNMTIAFWMKSSSSSYGTPISRLQGSGFTNAEWTILGSGGVLYVDFYDSSASGYMENLKSIATLYDNNWHHVAISWNGTALGSAILIYVDGSLQTGTSPTTSGFTNIDDTAVPTNIGTQNNGASDYNGSLDEVMIFNASLNSTQITDLYNLNRSTYNGSNTNLVSYWDFDGLTNNYNDVRGLNNGVRNGGVFTPAYSNQFGQENSSAMGSLVAYYSFDSDNISGTGTTAYDFTSNNNDGTYNGNAQVNSSCIYDNCSSFDGTGDYINVPDSSVFDMNQITVSAWVKANKYGVALARQIPAGNTQFTLEAGNNYVAFYINAGASTDKAEATNPAIGATGNGQWVHLVGTFNGTNQSIYVNGVLNGSITHAVSLNQMDQPLKIGYSPTPAWNPDFNGSIDEVMIFNTALTPAQVLSIYQNTSQRFFSQGNTTTKWQNFSNSTENRLNISVSFLENNFGTNNSMRVGYWNLTNGYDNTNASLVAYYHADSDANDSSGNGNDGTLTNGANASSVGVFNNSFGFDGSNDYINISDSNSLDVTGQLTISSWIYLNQIGVTPLFVSKRTGTSTNYQFWSEGSDSNKLYFGSNDGSWHTASSNTGLVANRLYHIAIVYTDSSDTVNFYIDGSLESSKSFTSSITTNNANLYIGRDGDAGTNYYNGTIDEVMIWNKSLSADEIKSLYIKGRVANVGVNWTYSPYQNITQPNVNYTFNISQNTTNFIVDTLQYSNASLFYSPLLGQAVNIISGFISGNVAPTSSQYSPANNSVSSSALVFLVANQSDVDSNLDYYTERIWQSNGTLVSTNITRITGSTNSTNFSVTLPFEGVYYWSGVANDTNGLTSSETNYTLTYDISFPQNVTFISPTATNNSLYSRTYIELNVTATDSTLLNITTYVYYSNGTLYWNKTNSTSYAFNNLTGVPDGVWKYNATACDTAGRCNSSETRYITLDGQAPSISLVLPLNNNLYNTSLVPLNGTATDAVGISSIWYNVLYSSLGTNSTYIGNTTFTFNTTIPISTSGSYWLIAWANDTSNNINNTGYRFFHVANNGTGNATSGGSSNTISTCAYKRLGYYNTQLVWSRRTDCL